jgi:ribosome maturation factor RimP
MPSISETVTGLIQCSIEKNAYELVDVEYIKEGKEWYLRIYIDTKNGKSINLDDCEKVSKIVSEILDNEDPIHNSYILEVSSPGIERPLKNENDYQKYAGNTVLIKLFSPIEGKKEIKGVLKGYENKNIVVESGESKYCIPKDKIASANLSVEFF